MIPISENQLRFHLQVPQARAEFIEDTDGFVLHVHHGGEDYVLTTQRGRNRAFKSLTRASDLLKVHGGLSFSVTLLPASGLKSNTSKKPATVESESPPTMASSRRDGLTHSVPEASPCSDDDRLEPADYFDEDLEFFQEDSFDAEALLRAIESMDNPVPGVDNTSISGAGDDPLI